MKKSTKKAIKKDLLILLLALCIFGAGIILLWISTFRVPDLNNFDKRIVAQSTRIFDRTGEIVLYDVHEDIRRTIVPYEKISRHIKNATVAIEDSEFYEHAGIKPTAILRAVLVQLNIFSGDYYKGQGGSTITQQVVKNSILTREKKIARKLKEWVLALQLEKVITKEQILTLYLNESPYGGNIYGIEEASITFFGKESENLSLAESAYLAAIPQAPTYYSPYGNNVDKLETRKNLVLSRMLAKNFITEEEYKTAKEEKVDFKPRAEKGIKSPHFVMYVKEYLENKYGAKVLTEGGLNVITTLDYELQEKAEEIAKEYALENAEKFNAENNAVVATDNKTGQILIMVGSRDYFDEEIDGNFNVAIAHRQPGSAFKPIVYATAFNEGYTPDTVVFDLETEFSTYCNPDGTPILYQYEDRCYSPVNYDGKYNGPVTLRNALAQSINIPAVKILYLAGLSDSLKLAKDMGINSLTNTDQYGLTLVLGGGEVSLLDITNVYSVFANNGIKNPHTPILKIEDNEGNIIEEFTPKSKRALPELSALYISDILSDNIARTPAFGSRSPLYFEGRDVAGKTGTTNDYRDAWTVGFTAQVSLGVWAGNNDNSSMEKKVAGFIVTPTWNAIMQEILAKYPDEKFKKPSLDYPDSLKPILRGIWQGGETYFIDRISGKLATDYTPEETTEERVVSSYHSILHWIDKKDPLGLVPEDPTKDPQYNKWEYSVQKWAQENGYASTTTQIPNEYDDIHTPEKAPKIKLVYPNAIKTYSPNERINILVSNNSYGGYPLMKLNFYFNGKFIGSSNSTTFSFVPSEIGNLKPENELKVIGFDSVYNKGETTTILKLSI